MDFARFNVTLKMQYSNQYFLIRSGGAHQYCSSISSSNYSTEEHIYEQIAESDTEDQDTTADSDIEDDSFLTLISSGRRNNLRYYGDASWDFGA